MIRHAATAAVIVLTVTACGGGGEVAKKPSNPIEKPSNPIEKTTRPAAKWPACDEVWVVGQKLPKDYDGCKGPEGIVPADPFWECADGTRLTFVDEPAAFARVGGEIKAGSNKSDKFAAEFDKCEPVRPD